MAGVSWKAATMAALPAPGVTARQCQAQAHGPDGAVPDFKQQGFCQERLFQNTLQPGDHPRHPILAHMRVDLRGRQVHMPEQHPDVHELGAGLQEPGCIGMPELIRSLCGVAFLFLI
jgi:hypothetical protein